MKIQMVGTRCHFRFLCFVFLSRGKLQAKPNFNYIMHKIEVFMAVLRKLDIFNVGKVNIQ